MLLGNSKIAKDSVADLQHALNIKQLKIDKLTKHFNELKQRVSTGSDVNIK